jgi:DhnA family fructose-bisphosphate aldolase class Ia
VSDCGKAIRLSRILRRQKSLVVAFDHASVLGPIPGTEDPGGQIERFVDAGADAVLLNLGLLRRFAGLLIHDRCPGIIARIDWTTIWGLPEQKENVKPLVCLVARPEDALRQGADGVLTYLAVGTGDADFEAQQMARNAKVARECESLGMPFILETIARGKNVENPRDPKWLNLHIRMAVELGADAVKTDYTGGPESMRKIVEGCPIPILVLGGSRYPSDEAALDFIRSVSLSGAAGVFIGRNVFQSSDVKSFLRQARLALDNTSLSEIRK